MKKVPSDVLVVAAFVVAVVSGVLREPRVLRDAIRAVEILEAGLVIVIALLIARRYWREYRAQPSRARLLPRHVARLGTGVALLTFAAVAGVIAHVGEPFKWYVGPVLFPAFTVLLVGLWDMVQWLPHRAVADEVLHDADRFREEVRDVQSR